VHQVASQHPAAAELLRICSFLHPDSIPEELFVAGAPYLGTELGPVVIDSYQFDLALAALRSASLIVRFPETRTLSVPRLVQAVFQDQMEAPQICMWGEQVVCMVNAAFPDGDADGNWTQCERYLAQALACFPLIKALHKYLPEASELLYKASRYLMFHGRHIEAEPLLALAVTLECPSATGPSQSYHL
jgi:hypothetical protein